MAKCSVCGRTIKNVYFLNGKEYGKECYKEVAQSIYAERQQLHFEELNRQRFFEALAIISVLKTKDLSKISNQFKLDFINSVVEQFETEGFLSQKQINFVNENIFNKTDDINVRLAKVELCEDSEKVLYLNSLITLLKDIHCCGQEGASKKLNALFNELIEERNMLRG